MSHDLVWKAAASGEQPPYYTSCLQVTEDADSPEEMEWGREQATRRNLSRQAIALSNTSIPGQSQSFDKTHQTFRDGHGPSALDECDFNELRDPAAGREINILPSDEGNA